MRVRCPDCDARLEVDDEDLGREVRCPSCRTVFAASPEGPAPLPDDEPRRRREHDDDEPDRPRRRRRYRPIGEFDDDPEELIEDARRAVNVPALLSIIACILTILYHTFDTVITLMNPQLLKNNPLMPGAQPPSTELVIAIKGFMLLYQCVVLAGSVAMMRMRAYKFSIAAMVMQIIPCAGPCCILGIGVGIWGLVVLNRPDVKDGFELAEREQGRIERSERDGEDGEANDRLR